MNIRTKALGLFAALLLVGLAGLSGFWHVNAMGTLVLLVATVAVALAAWRLLEHTVLARLARLRAEIARVGQAADFRARVNAEGADEVAQLGQAVNNALDGLSQAHTLLQATLESTDAGVLIVDALGRPVSANRRFTELWDVSAAALVAEGEAGFQRLAAQTTRPEQTLARFRYWLSRPAESGRDEFELLAGRTLECFTRPQRPDDATPVAGRTWDCRDITSRKQTEATLNRQMGEMITVHDIALAGAEATSEEELVELASKIIGANLYPRDIFNIGLVDQATGGLQVLSSHYVRGEIASDIYIQAGRGITGRAVVTGRAQIVADVRQDPAYVEINPDTRAEICVPMRVGPRVIGFLNVESAKPGAYGEADERLLSILAGQLTTALEKVRMASEVQRLAITDSLTGLYNRRYFFATAQRELERTRRHDRPLSVIMLDLDHFKGVNDTYGHAAGDQTLKAVADFCRKNLREADVLGRYGGEEFVVLLPETSGAVAQEVAERLRRGIAALTIAVPNHTVTVTASLGVAALDSRHPGLDKLLDCADQALYQAKAAGRNCFCIYSDKPADEPAGS